MPWAENFGHLGGGEYVVFSKQFTIGFSKPQFTCLGKQIENIYFVEYHGFRISSIFWPFFCFCQKKLSPWGVKTAFGESGWRLWGFFFERKTMILCNFCTLSGRVSDFCKLITAGFPNINLSVQGINLRKTFKKLYFYSIFCTLRKKFSDFERKISGQGFENHIRRVQENILTKYFSWKIDSFPVNLRDLNENFPDFWWKHLRHGFQIINLRVQEKVLWSFFYRIDGILVFSILERKILGCWLNIIDKVFETTTYISRETIRDKLFSKKVF